MTSVESALDVTTRDVTAASSPTTLTSSAPSTAHLATADLCHRHLFLRTDAVAMRFNAHLYKFLRHVEAAIQSDPDARQRRSGDLAADARHDRGEVHGDAQRDQRQRLHVAPGDAASVGAHGDVHDRLQRRHDDGRPAPGGQPDRGVTCSESGAEQGDFGERFWLMKEEDSTGATVPGLSFSDTQGHGPCDPALVATTPSLTDATRDFGFSAIDFSSATPYPFPKS